MVDKDAVVGYDFFKSFTVLLNRREMRLIFLYHEKGKSK
jgi:hypothetical protein